MNAHLIEFAGGRTWRDVDVTLDTHWVEIRRDGKPVTLVPREHIYRIDTDDIETTEPF